MFLLDQRRSSGVPKSSATPEFPQLGVASLTRRYFSSSRSPLAAFRGAAATVLPHVLRGHIGRLLGNAGLSCEPSAGKRLASGGGQAPLRSFSPAFARVLRLAAEVFEDFLTAFPEGFFAEARLLAGLRFFAGRFLVLLFGAEATAMLSTRLG